MVGLNDSKINRHFSPKELKYKLSFSVYLYENTYINYSEISLFVFCKAVSPSGAIEITEPILLDTETERVSSVWIGNGGRLVFDPTAPLAKLTAGRITIDDEGYLDIGSADCPFAGNAEILLTGNYHIWRSISQLSFQRS